MMRPVGVGVPVPVSEPMSRVTEIPGATPASGRAKILPVTISLMALFLGVGGIQWLTNMPGHGILLALTGVVIGAIGLPIGGYTYLCQDILAVRLGPEGVDLVHRLGVRHRAWAGFVGPTYATFRRTVILNWRDPRSKERSPSTWPSALPKLEVTLEQALAIVVHPRFPPGAKPAERLDVEME